MRRQGASYPVPLQLALLWLRGHLYALARTVLYDIQSQVATDIERQAPTAPDTRAGLSDN